MHSAGHYALETAEEGQTWGAVRLPQGQGPGLRVREALASSLPAHSWGSPIPAQPVCPPFPATSGLLYLFLASQALCPVPSCPLLALGKGIRAGTNDQITVPSPERGLL